MKSFLFSVQNSFFPIFWYREFLFPYIFRFFPLIGALEFPLKLNRKLLNAEIHFIQWRIQGGAAGVRPPPKGPDSFILTYKSLET